MLTLLLAMMAVETPPGPIMDTLKTKGAHYCRPVVVGASRSGDVLVCRTKSEWSRYDSCHGPTRWCNPTGTRESFGRQMAFAMNADSQIVCKKIKATGSRLAHSQLCLARREWERLATDTSQALYDLQNRSAIRPNEELDHQGVGGGRGQ